MPATGLDLPTYLIVGAMKSGTSTLQRALGAHPDVFTTTPKELHFFGDDDKWSGGLDAYRACFASGTTATARGEASVSYAQWPQVPHVPERIASTVPDVRIVYLVRDPVARMLSQYKHDLAALWEFRPVERALTEDPKYVDWSRYAMQLGRYLDHFPAEHILVLQSERYFADPVATARTVYSFIGVSPDAAPPPPRVNRTDQKHAPTPLSRALINSRITHGGGRIVPAPARRWIKQHVPRHSLADERIELSDQLVERLREQLSDDVRALRAFLPDDFDGWGIA